jgi:adenylate cyclase
LLPGQPALERRLAAILAADVVGYSRLMEQDEAGTMAALAERRKAILEPLLTKYRGRVIRLMGDGTLAEFASAVDAVQCAVDIQKATREANSKLPEDRAIVLRVGLNLGDVVVEEGDLYGDGVNVAARLEAMADPGGICLSAAIHQQVERLLPFTFRDLGDQALKNIARPVRVYCIANDDGAGGGLHTGTPIGRTFSVQSKPSVAVLPFINMSGDPEQEYFSDGITEDIITDLSKISTLNVLSRNTTFTFKGKAVDIGQIAQRLKVGYVIEGSVRKAGGRVRITAQLIDASKDSHVWGERYDRELNDIFALQDEISAAIVTALKVKLLPEERRAIEKHGTVSAEAYQFLLMARHYRHFGVVSGAKLVLRLANRAVEIDPNYAEAWALIAACQITLHENAGVDESGLRAAERALQIDPRLAAAHAAKGRVLAGLGRHDEALAAHAQSLHLDPESFDAHFFYGHTCTGLGRAELAIHHLEKAATLVETDYTSLGLVGQSYEALGRNVEALDANRRALARMEEAIARRPDDTTALYMGAASLATLGKTERAREWATRAFLLAPDEPVGLYNLACTFAMLGDRDRAIDLLERYAVHMRPQFVAWIKNDSDLNSLRDDERFQALIQRLEARLAATS